MKKAAILLIGAYSFSAAAASEIDILRTNTQNALNSQLAYSNQIEKRAIMNTKSITALSGRVTVNTNDISSLKANKLDKTIFVADQKRQDTALANETEARIEGDKRTAAAIGNKVDQTTYEGDKLSTANAISGKVDGSVYEGDRVAVSERLDGKVDTAAYRTDQAQLQSASSDTRNQVSGLTGAVNKNASDIADLRATSNASFKSLRDRVDAVKKRSDAGVASVAAMASIPGLSNGQRFNVGAGVGVRGSEQAVSVGMSAAVNTRLTIKAAVSADTNSGFTAGAGAAFGW